MSIAIPPTVSAYDRLKNESSNQSTFNCTIIDHFSSFLDSGLSSCCSIIIPETLDAIQKMPASIFDKSFQPMLQQNGVSETEIANIRTIFIRDFTVDKKGVTDSVSQDVISPHNLMYIKGDPDDSSSCKGHLFAAHGELINYLNTNKQCPNCRQTISSLVSTDPNFNSDSIRNENDENSRQHTFSQVFRSGYTNAEHIKCIATYICIGGLLTMLGGGIYCCSLNCY